MGCQNTSIQWYDFDIQDTTSTIHEHNSMTIQQRECINQKARFFNSFQELGLNNDKPHYFEEDVIQCVIKSSNVYSNAHDGYVYCMTLSNNLPNIEGEVLITGSGDGNIKIWSIVENKSVKHYQTLTGGDPDRGILSLSISDDGYLFCGVQGGHVQVSNHI